MRIVPIEFPCGCRMVREFQDGQPLMVSYYCDPHGEGHASMISIDDASYEGCDCPGCEFGRYASRRGPTPQVDAENWKFLAGLAARRRREATA